MALQCDTSCVAALDIKRRDVEDGKADVLQVYLPSGNETPSAREASVGYLVALRPVR